MHVHRDGVGMAHDCLDVNCPDVGQEPVREQPTAQEAERALESWVDDGVRVRVLAMRHIQEHPCTCDPPDNRLAEALGVAPQPAAQSCAGTDRHGVLCDIKNCSCQCHMTPQPAAQEVNDLTHYMKATSDLRAKLAAAEQREKRLREAAKIILRFVPCCTLLTPALHPDCARAWTEITDRLRAALAGKDSCENDSKRS